MAAVLSGSFKELTFCRKTWWLCKPLQLLGELQIWVVKGGAEDGVLMSCNVPLLERLYCKGIMIMGTWAYGGAKDNMFLAVQGG